MMKVTTKQEIIPLLASQLHLLNQAQPFCQESMAILISLAKILITLLTSGDISVKNPCMWRFIIGLTSAWSIPIIFKMKPEQMYNKYVPYSYLSDAHYITWQLFT